MFKKLIDTLLRKAGCKRIGINRNKLTGIRYNDWKCCCQLSIKLENGDTEVIDVDTTTISKVVSNINRLFPAVDKLGILIAGNVIFLACEDPKCNVMDIEAFELEKSFGFGSMIKLWIDPDKFIDMLPENYWSNVENIEPEMKVSDIFDTKKYPGLESLFQEKESWALALFFICILKDLVLIIFLSIYYIWVI